MKKKFTLYEWHFPLKINKENKKKCYPFDPLRALRIAQTRAAKRNFTNGNYITYNIKLSVSSKYEVCRPNNF